MPKFVPVVDTEKPLSEQLGNHDPDFDKHRRFDNPHAVPSAQGAKKVDRGWQQGSVGWGVLKNFGGGDKDSAAQVRAKLCMLLFMQLRSYRDLLCCRLDDMRMARIRWCATRKDSGSKQKLLIRTVVAVAGAVVAAVHVVAEVECQCLVAARPLRFHIILQLQWGPWDRMMALMLMSDSPLQHLLILTTISRPRNGKCYCTNLQLLVGAAAWAIGMPISRCVVRVSAVAAEAEVEVAAVVQREVGAIAILAGSTIVDAAVAEAAAVAVAVRGVTMGIAITTVAAIAVAVAAVAVAVAGYRHTVTVATDAIVATAAAAAMIVGVGEEQRAVAVVVAVVAAAVEAKVAVVGRRKVAPTAE